MTSCFGSMASRAEPGCLRIDVFESLREPFVFAIHSEWVDEASFELHAALPHTVRFLEAAQSLLKDPSRVSDYNKSVVVQARVRR